CSPAVSPSQSHLGGHCRERSIPRSTGRQSFTHRQCYQQGLASTRTVLPHRNLSMRLRQRLCVFYEGCAELAEFGVSCRGHRTTVASAWLSTEQPMPPHSCLKKNHRLQGVSRGGKDNRTVGAPGKAWVRRKRM